MEVTGLQVQNDLSGSDCITGIESDGEVIEADYIVNAAGASGGRIAAMADVEIPISPKRRNGFLIEPEDPIPDDWPFLIDLDTGLWIRPAPSDSLDGTVFLGGEFDGEDPTRDPDDPELLANSIVTEWEHKALDQAASTIEHIGENPKIYRGWSGMYAITPSNHPIIEESLPGFVNAIGNSGRGFMQSPAIGKVVQHIVTGDDQTLVDTNVLRTDGLVDKRGSLPIPYTADKN